MAPRRSSPACLACLLGALALLAFGSSRPNPFVSPRVAGSMQEELLQKGQVQPKRSSLEESPFDSTVAALQAARVLGGAAFLAGALLSFGPLTQPAWAAAKESNLSAVAQAQKVDRMMAEAKKAREELAAKRKAEAEVEAQKKAAKKAGKK
eukprot:TRINITY_DN79170_c0_g1_i1.p1 TRINITY_DN79170_c0_g1~~TRINITY_DN79170_c0_g1_i1.p1  ORF type:complete len:151 (+),score=49.53 TRINITY_DN79170_c0_g1_i1:58-510(+)